VPLCAVVIACDRIFVYNEAYVVKYVHNTERIGCRIYKYFIYSLAWISFLTPFILTGVLLGPEHGAWVGMLVAVILTCVYGLLGDRLFLSYVEARDLNRERRLKNKINNYSYLLELGHVEVFEGTRLNQDVLVLHGPGKRKQVVIGSQLMRTFNEDQIDSLLLAALIEFKTKSPQSLRLAVLFYAPYVLVLLAFRKVFGQGILTSLLSFFFYPAWLIHESLLEVIKREQSYKSIALESFPESLNIAPTLYRLRLLQIAESNQTYFRNYMKSFSLLHEGTQEGLFETQGMGVYGRQE